MRRTKKPHPALKHGGYSAMGLLPGESAVDFEKLHRDLISELAPAGALENDTVASMARVIWRGRNLATFRVAEAARQHYDKIRDEKGANVTFLGGLDLGGLGGLEPADPERLKAARQAAKEQARKELGSKYDLIEIGEIATISQMLKEIDVEERLDAMINRYLKRLLFLRGLKSLSPTSQAAQPPRIPPLTEAA